MYGLGGERSIAPLEPEPMQRFLVPITVTCQTQFAARFKSVGTLDRPPLALTVSRRHRLVGRSQMAHESSRKVTEVPRSNPECHCALQLGTSCVVSPVEWTIFVQQFASCLLVLIS
jgi:hypothetical protein